MSKYRLSLTGTRMSKLSSISDGIEAEDELMARDPFLKRGYG